MRKKLLIIIAVAAVIIIWYFIGPLMDALRGTGSVPSESQRLAILDSLAAASPILAVSEDERQEVLELLEKSANIPSREERIRVLEDLERKDY